MFDIHSAPAVFVAGLLLVGCATSSDDGSATASAGAEAAVDSASPASAAQPYGEEPGDIFTDVAVPADSEPYTSTWDEGSLKERGFVQDAAADEPVFDGVYQSWYPDGAKRSEGRWVDGRRHGAWHFWHPNGRQRLEGFFVEGRLDRSRFWVERGPDGEWIDGHPDAARAAGEQPRTQPVAEDAL